VQDKGRKFTPLQQVIRAKQGVIKLMHISALRVQPVSILHSWGAAVECKRLLRLDAGDVLLPVWKAVEDSVDLPATRKRASSAGLCTSRQWCTHSSAASISFL
jgi:hypothetical protein